jgi:hypothetical protein
MSYVTSNINQSSTVLPDSTAKISDPDHAHREHAKDKLHKAEAEGSHLWAVTKEKLFQPAVAGGLFSVGEWAWASAPRLARS